MAIAEAALEVRAKRAYETGRVLLGVRRAAAVAPMAAVSLIACGQPGWTLLDAGILAACVTLLVWRGGNLGLGAHIGLWAGVPPLVAPMIVQVTGHLCGGSFCSLFPAACFLGGVAGGVLLGAWGARRKVDAYGLVAAGLVAGLAGTLGCMLAGLGGLAGLVLGLGLGATPLIALRRA